MSRCYPLHALPGTMLYTEGQRVHCHGRVGVVVSPFPLAQHGRDMRLGSVLIKFDDGGGSAEWVSPPAIDGYDRRQVYVKARYEMNDDVERAIVLGKKTYELPKVEGIGLSGAAVRVVLTSKEDAERVSHILSILFGVAKGGV
jgi:hypothetical protein